VDKEHAKPHNAVNKIRDGTHENSGAGQTRC
jgi:hypothetical protein